MGNRESFLRDACNLIVRSCGILVAKSSIYETEAWGKEDQHAFLNQALTIETELEAIPLLHALLRIEQELGRTRGEKYGPRTIDIDIIFFNSDIVHTPDLTIPHPQIQNRRFALQCLADIEPEYVHPVLQKTVEKLLLDCQDPLQARLLSSE